jgi:hypothetical protein
MNAATVHTARKRRQYSNERTRFFKHDRKEHAGQHAGRRYLGAEPKPEKGLYSCRDGLRFFNDSDSFSGLPVSSWLRL